MNWINVKDKLPQHKETILCYTPKGQCVCVFVDTKKMNEFLLSKGFTEEQLTLNKEPYSFCSQEIQGYVLNNITHWIPLPEPPNE